MRQAYRSALVTGASSGIGEATARVLAARGTELVVVARRADRLERLAAELRERHGVGVEVLSADLTDVDQLAAVEQRLADAERPIELLVNCAGMGTSGPFVERPIARAVAEINLNVVALVRLTHAALPGMVARRHGGVLNVSSLAGEVPSPGGATYAASKAYVTSFSVSLHGEVKRRGVHVTALLPGFTRTEFHPPGTAGRPAILWLSADEVARAGLAAVAAGRATCVPGPQYRVVAPLVRLVPRALVREAAVRAWRR